MTLSMFSLGTWGSCSVHKVMLELFASALVGKKKKKSPPHFCCKERLAPRPQKIFSSSFLESYFHVHSLLSLRKLFPCKMQSNRFLIPLAAFCPRSLCKWLGLTPSCSGPGGAGTQLPWGWYQPPASGHGLGLSVAGAQRPDTSISVLRGS